MMKTRIPFTLFSIIAAFLLNPALGQTIPGINYQGVARNLDGSPRANQAISIRISILSNSSSGSVEYSETHELATNQFGLFSLVIGKGASQVNSFAGINWSNTSKWLQVEMDDQGGSNFQVIGTQQLLGVPFALYAQEAGANLTAGDGIEIANNQIINKAPDQPVTLIGVGATTISGTYPAFTVNTQEGDADPANELINGVSLEPGDILRITDAGGNYVVDLSGIAGADDQALTFDSPTGQLTIEDGNTVTITDVDPGNELITGASLVGTDLNLTDAGGTRVVDLSSLNDPGTDDQGLTFNSGSGQLTIEDGNTVTITDVDPGNELITGASLVGTDLNLTDAGGTRVVDLSSLNDPGTDDQGLTFNSGSGQLTIEDGNSVTITDVDPSNEIQNLSQVLTQNNDASGTTITNLPIPVNASDVATKSYVDINDASVANNYAFRVDFNYTPPPGGATNELLDLSTPQFDVSGVLSGNDFTAQVDGIYVFYVTGTTTDNVPMSIIEDGTPAPVVRSSGFTILDINYNGTYMFQLTAGQTIQLRIDSAADGDNVTGSFFGYKL